MKSIYLYILYCIFISGISMHNNLLNTTPQNSLEDAVSLLKTHQKIKLLLVLSLIIETGKRYSKRVQRVYCCCLKVRMKETNYTYLDRDDTWVNWWQDDEEGNEILNDQPEREQTEAFMSQDLAWKSQLYIPWKSQYLSKLQKIRNTTLS